MRGPPGSDAGASAAASEVYKGQVRASRAAPRGLFGAVLAPLRLLGWRALVALRDDNAGCRGDDRNDMQVITTFLREPEVSRSFQTDLEQVRRTCKRTSPNGLPQGHFATLAPSFYLRACGPKRARLPPPAGWVDSALEGAPPCTLVWPRGARGAPEPAFCAPNVGHFGGNTSY